MSKPKDAIFKHEKNLCAAFADKIVGIPELKLFFDESMSAQSGVLSILSSRIGSDELAERLGKANICVRAGLHCAPTAHETVGTIEEGTVRFSFSPFNTLSEVSFAADSLKKILNTL